MYSKDIANYYLWDDSIKMVSQKEFDKTITEKRGYNGTSPSVVAR
jgi:hypothetical protein